jgi:hypothetical protein
LIYAAGAVASLASENAGAEPRFRRPLAAGVLALNVALMLLPATVGLMALFGLLR